MFEFVDEDAQTPHINHLIIAYLDSNFYLFFPEFLGPYIT